MVSLKPAARVANPDTPPDQLIVLFDGVCNLCAGWVRFIIRRDPHARFRFAALQSEAARRLLGGHDRGRDLDSLVLLDGGGVYERSTAVLRIARRLAFPWPLFYALIAIPRPIRDALYRAVARRRYRWFGRQDVCMVPTPELRRRFVE